jgi:hypothetical protein
MLRRLFSYGVTEAEDAGVDLDVIRGAVALEQIKKTARYSKVTFGRSWTVVSHPISPFL